MFKKLSMGLATLGAVASQAVPVPYALSDGLAIYRSGKGEPVLFMPYPHAASVMGDPMLTAIIEGLEQADREIISFRADWRKQLQTLAQVFHELDEKWRHEFC